MKKKVLTLFMLLAIALGAFPETVLAKSTDTRADGDFNQKVDSLLDQKGYSGTLLVIKNGKPIYETSRGFADYANGINNDKDTTYEIDSVQKSMTAAMIMKQVQDGKLKLSDKLAKFYPQIPGSRKITIRQMLDMTSGLILKGNIGPSRILSDEDIIHEDINNIKFSNFLHGKWDYQAINFNLLSGILEKLTGDSYHQLFIDTFVKKLDGEFYNQVSHLKKK
ncbi:serine hydrolase domain-containing protein [Companilactobacillus futsaii]|uniref:Beta-lactamase class C related penicillin binding protein n=1 Tax=Companilactobacillus futsaii JCM 17355 TaxID=1423818 RepID=A0ABR5P787_9LACO|nr:serine hydrolase domain-containing protein [Companilactobacillus futsaii]KRK95153.1 Beta-lactamase class C related penicillin binding protein [Companilactobacillus futsaii JCM 17355]